MLQTSKCDSDRCFSEVDSAMMMYNIAHVIVSDDDTYRNHLDFYTCQQCLSKMSNNTLVAFIFCHFV